MLQRKTHNRCPQNPCYEGHRIHAFNWTKKHGMGGFIREFKFQNPILQNSRSDVKAPEYA